jgi:hypothetical protein
MKCFALVFLLLSSGLVYCQRDTIAPAKTRAILTPEIAVGITAASNSFFPERSLQKQIGINLGWEHDYTTNTWAQMLKAPRTGISFAFTDFGNRENLGYALTAMPFIEFNAMHSNRLKLQIGTGPSYFTTKYDSISNPNNKAVTTQITWSFKLFGLYQFSFDKTVNWRLGLGYFHHSNGHTRLPNHGFNSFLLVVSGDLPLHASYSERRVDSYVHSSLTTKYSFSETRYGLGFNVLTRAFNNRTEVHTIATETGWVYNQIFKVGIGLYYRFYRGYYDYIKGNESLVQDGREFDHFKNNPLWYASNIGVTTQGELLLNHIGISLQLGFNLYKPAYRLDWRLNQGWFYVPREFPEQSNVVLGEYTTKYWFKRLVSSRLGLKYYIIGTQKMPEHNLYVGCFINSNLGQADFSEISLGYIHSFNFRKKK